MLLIFFFHAKKLFWCQFGYVDSNTSLLYKLHKKLKEFFGKNTVRDMTYYEWFDDL